MTIGEYVQIACGIVLVLAVTGLGWFALRGVKGDPRW